MARDSRTEQKDTSHVPGLRTGHSEALLDKASDSEQKESLLPAQLRLQYAKQDKLPANPIDGREHAIVGVQLSLIETQKIEKPQRDGETKEETKTQPKRQLEDLLRQEESALYYYESWHNVTTTIPVSEILEPRGSSSPIRRALVVGPAGIGKTTLLHYLAYQWGSGKLWNERFQAMFWLPLRCLLKEKYRHHYELSVAILLHEECLDVTAQKAIPVKQLQQFLEQNKDRVALLLDGYDECAVEVEEEKSMVAKVFQELLEVGSVIMTSRPYRLNQTLVKKFDRHLENRGFSNTQIQQYITDYFFEAPALAKSLTQRLTHQPRLQGMAHVPINLALLCGLHQEEIPVSSPLATQEMKEKEKKCESPCGSSLAETFNLSSLYHQLTGYLIKRYLKERTGQDIRRVEDLNLLMDYCRDELNFLGHLAFLGLTQREILLSPKLFERLAQTYRVQPYLPDQALRLGFLQKAGEGNCRGETFTPHYFIHLSFQEFFAARFLTESLKHPSSHPRCQEAMQFLRTEKYQPRYAMVFRFAAGLSSQDKTQNKALLSFWKALLSQPLDMTGVGHMCLMIRCLDETAGDERVPHRKVLLREVEGVFKQFFEEVRKAQSDELINNLSSTILDRLLLELQDTIATDIVTVLNNILLAALKDKNDDVRSAAAKVLGQLGDKAATQPTIQALLTALKDKEYFVRFSAAQALCQLGSGAATESVILTLLSALEDKDFFVRSAAVQALGQLGAKAATKPVIPTLLAVLKDKEWWVRKTAAHVLGQLGAKAATESVVLVNLVSDLLKMLDEERTDVREAAAEVLGQLGARIATKSVLLALQAALKDKDNDVRKAAAQALGQLGEKGAKVLLAGLIDENDHVRSAAAEAFGQLGGKGATEPVLLSLLEMLKDENGDVRSQAATALGQLGDKAATEPVIRALLVALKDEKSSSVRSAAAHALGRLGDKAVAELVVLALLAALKDKSDHVRSAAAKALGQLGDKAATENVISLLLETMLKDESFEVQGAAAHALGRLGNKVTTEPVILALLVALKDKCGHVRDGAAEALGQLGDKSATKPVILALLVMLKDKEGFVRITAAKALLKFSRPAVLTHYLQTSVSLFSGVNKDYAQYLAKPLLQCTALTYDRTQLLLCDGQTLTIYPVTTKDQHTLVQALISAFDQQAKLFGLPITLTQCYLKNREAYPITEILDLPEATLLVAPVLACNLSAVEPRLLLGVLRKEQATQQAEQQQQQIRTHPALWEYYCHFTQYFTEAWMACGTIHSGRVANAEKLKLDHVVTAVEKVADSVVDLLPFHIPGYGTLKTLFTSGASYYTHRQKQEAVNQIAGFFSPLEGMPYIELLARVLTLSGSETIERTAEPFAVSRWQQLKHLGKAAVDVVLVSDVNTPLKELAQKHIQLILQAIVDKRLKPHPQSGNLRQFVELVQASMPIEHLNLFSAAADSEGHLLEHKAEPSPQTPSAAKDLEATSLFKQKLTALITHADGGFSFLIKRPVFNRLQLQFTAADKILMTEDGIRKELIELIKLFKQAITELNITPEQYNIELNWKDWTLTITADPTILNRIGELLQSAGAKYFQSAPQAKAVLFGTPLDRSLSSATAELEEHQSSMVSCILQ